MQVLVKLNCVLLCNSTLIALTLCSLSRSLKTRLTASVSSKRRYVRSIFATASETVYNILDTSAVFANRVLFTG